MPTSSVWALLVILMNLRCLRDRRTYISPQPPISKMNIMVAIVYLLRRVWPPSDSDLHWEYMFGQAGRWAGQLLESISSSGHMGVQCDKVCIHLRSTAASWSCCCCAFSQSVNQSGIGKTMHIVMLILRKMFRYIDFLCYGNKCSFSV